MILPHLTDPLTEEDRRATFEMRGWMEEVNRRLDGETATTTQLADISDPINTRNKRQFKIIGNTTSGRMVYASGQDPGDVWLFFDGTTAHTPA